MPTILDLSHHQPHVDFHKVRAAGVLGIIHKATQGLKFVDARYATRRELAGVAGVLYGAYHFGTGDDVRVQVAHFLKVTGGAGLLALDVERNPAGSTMTQAQAEGFVAAVFNQTKRWPLLYGGADYLGRFELGNSILTNCPIWWAHYTSKKAPSRIPAVWPSWTLWQWSSTHKADGVGPCDHNRFNGTEEQLRAFWTPEISTLSDPCNDNRR